MITAMIKADLLTAYRLPQANFLAASNCYLPGLAASKWACRLPPGATIIISDYIIILKYMTRYKHIFVEFVGNQIAKTLIKNHPEIDNIEALVRLLFK